MPVPAVLVLRPAVPGLVPGHHCFAAKECFGRCFPPAVYRRPVPLPRLPARHPQPLARPQFGCCCSAQCPHSARPSALHRMHFDTFEWKFVRAGKQPVLFPNPWRLWHKTDTPFGIFPARKLNFLVRFHNCAVPWLGRCRALFAFSPAPFPNRRCPAYR